MEVSKWALSLRSCSSGLTFGDIKRPGEALLLELDLEEGVLASEGGEDDVAVGTLELETNWACEEFRVSEGLIRLSFSLSSCLLSFGCRIVELSNAGDTGSLLGVEALTNFDLSGLGFVD